MSEDNPVIEGQDPLIEGPDPIVVEETGPYQREGNNWVAVIETDGGVQKFVGATKDEVSAKLIEAQAHATRKIRQQERVIKLGGGNGQPFTPDQEEILPEFKGQELSAEEQAQIVADFQDPTRAWAAMQRAMEATLGADLDTVRNTLKLAPEIRAALKARAAGEQFAANHPEFVPSHENAKIITDFLTVRKLPATLKNLEYAFSELTNMQACPLELYDAKTAVAATPIAVPDPVAAVATPAAPPVVSANRPRAGSTSLSPHKSGAAAGSVAKAGEGYTVTLNRYDPVSQKMAPAQLRLTKQVLDAMSSEEYRGYFSRDENFRKAVEKLLGGK